MYLDPSLPVGIKAGALAACSGALLAAALLEARAGDVLTPLRVVGESAFHHAGSLSEITMLSDGKRMISTSDDGTARLWDIESGREIRRFLREETSTMWGLLVLPGEKEFLTADGGGNVTRWDLGSGKLLATYEHEGTVFRLALRPGHREFVATDSKNLAVLWNLESGEKLRTFKGHTAAVYTALFSADGRHLLTGSSDGRLKMWDVDTGECARTYEKEMEDVYTIAPSPDGRRFVSCSADSQLRVFETDTLKVLWKREMDDEIKVACWSPDGKRVATACEDRNLYVFDAEKGKRLTRIEVPRGYHTPVAFTTDGKGLFSGGDHLLYHHDLESGKWIVPPAGKPKLCEGVESLALAGDGKRVFAMGGDDVIQVWDTTSGKPVLTIETENSVESMATSPDGELLATSESDGTVRLRAADTGGVKREFQVGASAEEVLFARKGKWLLAAGTDDKVHLWDVATGAKVRSFDGHGNDVNGMAVSQDGLTLVTASDDKTARLWELETGKLLREFAGVGEHLYRAACLADGRSFLISAYEPGLWGWIAPPLPAAAELPRAEIDRLVADLSAEEYATRDAATKALTDRGLPIIPVLETLNPDHPEAVFRLRSIKSKIRTAQYEGELETLHQFDEDVVELKADPSGRYWFAVVGSEADARIVVGEVRAGKLHILNEIADGHGPAHLSFSADGSMLASGNRDGTVSLFALTPGE